MTTRRMVLTQGIKGFAAAMIAPLWATAARASEAFPFSRTDAEWRKQLSSRQYTILRQSGTERAFSSPLLNEHRRGDFACAGCDQDAFASTTKFESGTGWPSFWAPIEGAVGTTDDRSFGTTRTAVHCNNCGGHLGHVFDDGPKPTGLRYCMNGFALRFKAGAA